MQAAEMKSLRLNRRVTRFDRMKNDIIKEYIEMYRERLTEMVQALEENE